MNTNRHNTLGTQFMSSTKGHKVEVPGGMMERIERGMVEMV